MEFTISKSEFLRGLRIAQSIADRKSTMPMLANVLLRATSAGGLSIAATDLNVSVSANLKATVAKEGGLTVEAKALHDLVAAAPGDNVTLRKADNNWAEVKAGKATYKLVGMSDRDFPRVPDAKEATLAPISGAILREMADRTLFSVCNDETRFHLNGIFFESNGQTSRMVSTDGHRLSKVERQIAAGPVLAAGVIIPKKGMVELRKLADTASECQIAIKSPYVYLVADDMTLAIKLIDAQFPPYEQVIPKTHKRTAVVSRTALVDALRRTQLMSSENRGVKFAFDAATLTVTSDNPDRGEVREEVEIALDGEPITIGFNPKYVVEMLQQVTAEKVAIELGTETDPAVIRPQSDEAYLGLVMPMKL